MSERYYIWSMEHRGYWRPNSWGYTPNRVEAGLYSKLEAYKILKDSNIVSRCNPQYPPEEMLIPEEITTPLGPNEC